VRADHCVADVAKLAELIRTTGCSVFPINLAGRRSAARRVAALNRNGHQDQKAARRERLSQTARMTTKSAGSTICGFVSERFCAKHRTVPNAARGISSNEPQAALSGRFSRTAWNSAADDNPNVPRRADLRELLVPRTIPPVHVRTQRPERVAVAELGKDRHGVDREDGVGVPDHVPRELVTVRNTQESAELARLLSGQFRGESGHAQRLAGRVHRRTHQEVRLALPRTRLAGDRGQADPRDQVVRSRKPGHVQARLGDDRPCELRADTGDLRKPLDGGQHGGIRAWVGGRSVVGADAPAGGGWRPARPRSRPRWRRPAGPE
jgi:hypothetical protein